MRATSMRRDAARLVGVDAGRMVTASFALAAALGALGGLVVAPLTQTAFDVGAGIGVKGFAAAILGGLGNPIAAVGGGLILGLLESLTAGYLNPLYKDAVALVVLARRPVPAAVRAPRRQGKGEGVMGARRVAYAARAVARGRRRRDRAPLRRRSVRDQGAHVRRPQLARDRRPGASLRPRWAGLAWPRRFRGARRLHLRQPHCTARAALARRLRGCRRGRGGGRGAAGTAQPETQGPLPGDGDPRVRRAHDASVRRSGADHRRRQRLHRDTVPDHRRTGAPRALAAVLACLGHGRRVGAARRQHGAAEARPGDAFAARQRARRSGLAASTSWA